MAMAPISFHSTRLPQPEVWSGPGNNAGVGIYAAGDTNKGQREGENIIFF